MKTSPEKKLSPAPLLPATERGAPVTNPPHQTEVINPNTAGWAALLLILILIAGSVSTVAQNTAANSAPSLAPLLAGTSDSSAPIGNQADWQHKRTLLRRHWLALLGEMPSHKAPLNTEILHEEQLPLFTRQHLRYQVEEGLFNDGYLLTPRGAQPKNPAVVVFHPTTPLHARGVAGLEPSYDPEKWQGPHLAQRGYIVWCPRNYIDAEGADWKGNVARVRSRHPQWTGMMRMLWDAIRAADFLESLPNVDAQRIGCLGHSLGAKEVLYAMAFDERYRAGVFSEGGIGLRFSNWNAPWYLGEQIDQPDFKREHHEVLALAAPRPFLLLAGESADTDASAAFLEAARPVYKLFNAGDALRFVNHRQGHRYSPEARAVAEEFLDLFLKRSAARP